MSLSGVSKIGVSIKRLSLLGVSIIEGVFREAFLCICFVYNVLKHEMTFKQTLIKRPCAVFVH